MEASFEDMEMEHADLSDMNLQQVRNDDGRMVAYVNMCYVHFNIPGISI